MSVRHVLVCSLVFVMLLNVSRAVEAAQVQFAVSMSVVQDGGGLLPGFAQGDEIAGTIGFDLNVMPFMQDASQALYSDAFTEFSFSIASQAITLESVEPSIVGVTNAAQDFLTVDHVVTSVLLGDFRATGFSIRFADLDGSAFDSTAIPTTIDIDDFEIRLISVEWFSPSNGPIALVLEVDSIQPVPIPAAAWLLASALILLRLKTR